MKDLERRLEAEKGKKENESLVSSLRIEIQELQSTCEAIVNDKLLDSLYQSDAGPISPIDILYGLRGSLKEGNDFMAHKCGFTYSTLLGAFVQAGFKKWIGGRRPETYDLFLIACKGEKSDGELSELAKEFLP